MQSVSSEAGELAGLSTGAQLLVFSSYRIKVKLQSFPSPLSTSLTTSPQITASWTHHTEFMSLSDFGSLSLSPQTPLPRGTSALLHLLCLHNLHNSPQRVPTLPTVMTFSSPPHRFHPGASLFLHYPIKPVWKLPEFQSFFLWLKPYLKVWIMSISNSMGYKRNI